MAHLLVCASMAFVPDNCDCGAGSSENDTEAYVISRTNLADFQFVVQSWCEQAEAPCSATQERIERLRAAGVLDESGKEETPS